MAAKENGKIDEHKLARQHVVHSESISNLRCKLIAKFIITRQPMSTNPAEPTRNLFFGGLKPTRTLNKRDRHHDKK